MARRPGPFPPRDFAARNLPIVVIPAGATFMRIHRTEFDALYFGTTGDNRFDDPDHRYGVCYAARSLEGAFAETCLRPVGIRLVPLSQIAARSVSLLNVVAKLRLVELHGPGLASMGATATVSSGTYDVSQPWSRAIHGHPAKVEGILYRSNHDNGEFCVALFDRCRDRLRFGSSTGMLEYRVRLAMLLDHYKMGLG